MLQHRARRYLPALLCCLALGWCDGLTGADSTTLLRPRQEADLTATDSPSMSALRSKTSLNGLWDFRPARDLLHVPTQPLWGALRVPGRWDAASIAFGGYNVWNESHQVSTSWEGAPLSAYPAGWYRLEVKIPDQWKGRILSLQVSHVGAGFHGLPENGVADESLQSNGRVLWNGEPAKMDRDDRAILPESTRWGGTNTLIIGVQSLAINQRWGKGINGDVWLSALPKVRVIDAWTWAANGSGHCRIELENDEPASQDLTIRGEIEKIGSLAPQSVVVEAGAKRTVDIELPAGSLPTWSPSKPTRLRLALTLEHGGQAVDKFERWCGFAEVQVKGAEVLLNNSTVHFLTESGPGYGVGPESYDSDFMRRYFQIYKQANYNSFRSYWGDAPEELYDLADEMGLMIQQILPSPEEFAQQIGVTAPTEEFWKQYGNRLARQIRVTRAHPSVVAYDVWSHQISDQMQNQPHYITGSWTPYLHFRDGDRALAKEGQKILHDLDPTRIELFDEAGNFGEEVNVHPYFDFSIPPQEWEDWPCFWAQERIKPLMATEFSFPYGPSWMEWDSRSWASDGSAPFFLEHAARSLGDRAYSSSPGSMVPEEWPPSGLAYTHQSALDPSLFEKKGPITILRLNPAVEEVSANLAQRVYRSWRTAGLHLGPFNHDSTTSPCMLVYPQVLQSVPLSWSASRCAGPKPDFMPQVTREYVYGALPFAPSSIAPSSAPRATKMFDVTQKAFAPLLAYIGGGPSQEVTSKDHAYFSSETIAKTLVFINDSEAAVQVKLSWMLQFAGATKADQSGSTTIEVAQGDRSFTPITPLAPPVQKKTEATLSLTASVDGHLVATDQMAVQIFPAAAPVEAATSEIVLYDPIGQTAQLLQTAGVPFKPYSPTESWHRGQILIIGSQCLQPDDHPFLEAADKGVNILLFAQKVGALSEISAFFGDRFSTQYQPELSTREVFISSPDHDLLKGLSDEDFSNWRGSSDSIPANPTASASFYLYSPGGAAPFKGSNRGVVATWTIPKPQSGNYQVLLSTGFDMSQSPLIEFSLPHARVIWCQLDVTSRYGKDPVATLLVQRLLKYAGLPAGEWNSTLYAGDEGELKLLNNLHAVFEHATPASSLSNYHTLILGRGGPSQIPAQMPQLRSWVEGGGHLILLPGVYPEVSGQLSPEWPVHLVADHLRKCLPPERSRAFAGLSGADFYFRWPIDCNVLPEKGLSSWNMSHPGVVGCCPLGQGEVTALQVDPDRLPNGPGTEPLAGKITRIYSTVLTNARVRLEEPFSLRPEVIDLTGPWLFRTDPARAGESEGWAQHSIDSNVWKPMHTPGLWELQDLPIHGDSKLDHFPYHGWIWYRKTISTPDSWKDKPLFLHIGGIAVGGKLFINGKLVAGTPANVNFFDQTAEIHLPPETWNAHGPNEVTFRVDDEGMGGGLTGPLYLYTQQDWLYHAPPVHYGIHYPNYDPEAYHYW